MRFVYSQKTGEAVFYQIIDDMQREYNDALFNSEERRARWIRVRGTCAIVTAMWLHGLGSFAKKAVMIWKAI